MTERELEGDRGPDHMDGDGLSAQRKLFLEPAVGVGRRSSGSTRLLAGEVVAELVLRTGERLVGHVLESQANGRLRARVHRDPVRLLCAATDLVQRAGGNCDLITR